ncbi:MAG TPA: DUF5682 family protein, partial [Acidimicrobiales bacterium]
PGSARAVGAALDELQPDVVLVEGAPELDGVLTLLGERTMSPPVAGLVYAVDEPSLASFYPMARFSPEWVAVRWALANERRVRFADLPTATMLALRNDPASEPAVRADPLGALAAVAGYSDAEAWWEDVIEHRYNGLAVFDAVLDAIRAVRASAPDGADAADEPGDDDAGDLFNLRREAAMRRVIREEAAGTTGVIAFVCGAWHAPALAPDAFPTASADNELLRGLPKVKVAATWVPWTTARLGRFSGYGAGVDAPGWYDHLYESSDAVVERWMTKGARLLRGEGIDVSSASVIDAVRLADALGALRLRPMPGVEEVMHAAEVTMCGGSAVPLALIERKLLVGDVLGRVPDDTPMVPLARDIDATAKRLRLKKSATEQTIELDLRKASHLDRSRFFHRLSLLGIPWASETETGRTKGTFKEAWIVAWEPELSVLTIEASGLGTTVADAVVSKVRQDSDAATDLVTLTELVEASLLAGLDDAVRAVIERLREKAAQQHDTTQLMAAIEPLARVSRYGDVRGAASEAVSELLDALVRRVAVGLGLAVASLDDDAAAQMRELLGRVHSAIALLDDRDLATVWSGALRGVADGNDVHGGVRGRAVRLLLDAGELTHDDARRRLSLALSVGADHVQAAAWIEAFLLGDALLLIHDASLLATLDEWIAGARPDVFDDVLPILRRAFARYEPAERRLIGEHAARGPRAEGAPADDDDELDAERTALVVPRIRLLLGARS